MSEKMEEEGTLDKRCFFFFFYDKTVLIGKVEARSNSKSQQRISVWCLGFPGYRSAVGNEVPSK